MRKTQLKMTARQARIYRRIVVSSAVLMNTAGIVWLERDPTYAAVAVGFLIMHMVAAVRDYRRGMLTG